MPFGGGGGSPFQAQSQKLVRPSKRMEDNNKVKKWYKSDRIWPPDFKNNQTKNWSLVCSSVLLYHPYYHAATFHCHNSLGTHTHTPHIDIIIIIGHFPSIHRQ